MRATDTNTVRISARESNTHVRAPLSGGDSPGGTIGGTAEATEPLIQPDRSIVIEVSNTSANERLGTAGVVYTEWKGLP